MDNKSTVLWRFALLGLCIGLIPLAMLAPDRYDQIDTERMLDSSVSIRTISHVTIDKYGDSVWDITNGSGFLVSSADCEVWTNHHVVAEAAIIEVYPRGWTHGAGIKARLLNSTPRSDIAILRLEHCDGIAQAVLGNSDPIRPGDETFAVGNPLGRNPDSISRGIISHTRRFRNTDIPYLQTDAAINPGNSGGALFDRQARVIGVNSAIDSTRNGANVGVGYAIPINEFMASVAELRQGPPNWGDAGISEIVSLLTPDEASVFGIPGDGGALVVTQTPADGPSQGLLQKHDVIYRIGDQAIEDMRQAERLVAQYKAGEKLPLELIRAGESSTVQIVLGEGWQAGSAQLADRYDGHLGMTVEMWDEEDGDRGQFKHPVITKVHSLGPAHKARIASSQSSIVMNGPYQVPYLLDVKTITGVAYRGRFHDIQDVAELEAFAEQAWRESNPLLLKIELWARPRPLNRKAALQHEGTAFFKLEPQRAGSDQLHPAPGGIMAREGSRPSLENAPEYASSKVSIVAER